MHFPRKLTALVAALSVGLSGSAMTATALAKEKPSAPATEQTAPAMKSHLFAYSLYSGEFNDGYGNLIGFSLYIDYFSDEAYAIDWGYTGDLTVYKYFPGYGWYSIGDLYNGVLAGY
jgi:hypothetical protein